MRLLNILFWFIILLHVGLFVMCKIANFSIQTSFFVLLSSYQIFIKRVFVLIKNILLHPILTITYIITKLLSFVFAITKELTHVGLVETFYLSIVFICFSLKIATAHGLSWLFKIPIAIIAWKLSTFVSPFFCILYDSIGTKLWFANLYIYKWLSNTSDSIYERLTKHIVTEKQSPSGFANNYIQDYINILQSKHNGNETSTQQTKHKTTYLDVLYPRELKILDLYEQDFTLEDLKKRKRELLKLHHPDNFHSPEDIALHKQKTIEINEAFTVISKVLSKKEA